MSYFSVGSEILCIARTTKDMVNMVARVNLLLTRIKNKSSELKVVISSNY